MAVYVTSRIYALGQRDGGRTITDSNDLKYTADDHDDDDALDGSDITITQQNLVFNNISYVGSFGNGWVCQYSGDYFLLSNDDLPNGTFVSASPAPLPVCFAAGTAIACPGGSRPVEALTIGDLVLTVSGEARPVRWIGRQAIVPFFTGHLRSNPIQIQAGALGENQPQRDLFVSPDHALFLEGLLVRLARWSMAARSGRSRPASASPISMSSWRITR